MITTLFPIAMGMSLAGSLLILVFLVFSPLSRRVFSARWHTRALAATLAFFLIPAGTLAWTWFAPFMPEKTHRASEFVETPLPLADLAFSQGQSSALLAGGTASDKLILLFWAWLGIACLLLAARLIRMKRFQSIVLKSCQQDSGSLAQTILTRVSREMGVRKDIPLYISPCMGSPMLMGIMRPVLILPGLTWMEKELELVLRHELTHYLHRDLWVKLAGLVVVSLHWFNPLVYLLPGKLNNWMELACDEEVVRDMGERQRKAYGAVILGVMEQVDWQMKGICAPFCSAKKTVKERLKTMLDVKRTNKRNHAVSMAVLVALVLVGTLVGAAFAPNPGKEAVGEAAPVLKDSEILTQVQDAAPAFLDTEEPPESAMPNQDTSDGPPSFVWPAETGQLTAGLGSYEGHTGIDVAAPANTEIYAAADGLVVLKKETYTGYGHYLVIDHGGLYQTLYAHCSSLEVEEGDEVQAGQLIAKVGRSGHATGNMLHFEVRYDGEIMDPLDYVSQDG